MTIKEHRQALGLTQEQFSKLFEPPIPINTIKKWDSGIANSPTWVEGIIIEKMKEYQKGNVKAILSQENVSAIMTALTIAKMNAEESVKSAKSQEEKELRENTAREWGEKQWEIGLKLGYYTEPKEESEEDAADLMMEMLKEWDKEK